LLLCTTATFKKTSFPTYFNQVSVGCRYSEVSTRLRSEGRGWGGEGQERKKEKGACSRNLEIWVVKKMTLPVSFCHK
jgi:hypothetical protein